MRISTSNHDEYRPISMEVRSDRHGLPTKKGTKGICLRKQETQNHRHICYGKITKLARRRVVACSANIKSGINLQVGDDGEMWR